MSINTKKLCQLIKREARRSLFWSKTEEGYTVTDRHFMVKFTEIPRDVMSTLLGIFLRTPEVGQSLQIWRGEIQDDCSLVSHKNIPKYEDANVDGKVTTYSKDLGGTKAKILQIGDSFYLVNEKYIALSTGTNVKSFGSEYSPIYLADGALLVLPYRYASNDWTQSELFKIITHFECTIQA